MQFFHRLETKTIISTHYRQKLHFPFVFPCIRGYFIKKSNFGGISVRAKGAGGGRQPPPEKFFSGKTAKIFVISKRFSGKMFGQTGFLPPPSREIFWAKRKFFSGKQVPPPQVRSCPYAYVWGGSHKIHGVLLSCS